MGVTRSRSIRDAILVFIGALSMLLAGSLRGTLQPSIYPENIIASPRLDARGIEQQRADLYAFEAQHIVAAHPNLPEANLKQLDLEYELPETKITAHAPGWTVFENLYMANGTLYVVSSHPQSDYPDIKYITSTGLFAVDSPENIAARMPTRRELSFITPEQARLRWGPPRAKLASKGARNRVFSVQGNTFLVNDPSQFLTHYYHFCAELLLGAWAMWLGAHNVDVPPESASQMTAPSIHRVIFPHADAQGWRDKPGFSSYFMRAAFPSLTVETGIDWEDRIKSTSLEGPNARAWHFETVLLADRSASFKGVICGLQVQRTAAEAYYAMKNDGRLTKWWWEPLRRAVLKFAGVDQRILEIGTRVEKAENQKINIYGDGSAIEGGDRNAQARAKFSKEKIVITYIERQGVRRHLIEEDHASLVQGLTRFADNNGYELNIVKAETLTKEQQLELAARTTVRDDHLSTPEVTDNTFQIMLGVHGNGLSVRVIALPHAG